MFDKSIKIGVQEEPNRIYLVFGQPFIFLKKIYLLKKNNFFARDGCAGTANYRIAGSSSHLHIMWSSPNNFDKHASHLAVGEF